LDESGAGTLPGGLTPAPGATPFGSQSQSGAAADAGAGAPAGDSSGQLGDGAPLPTGEAIPPGAEGQGADPAAADPSVVAEFEFAGQKFPSREAAEAYYKRVAGTYRTAQSETAKITNTLRDLEARIAQADTTSRGWYERAQELERSNQKVEEAKKAEADKSRLPFGLSRDDFKFAGNLANEHGFEYGALVLFQKAEADIQNQVNQAIEARTGPVEQTQHRTQLLDNAMGMWKDAAYAQDQGGRMLCPELQGDDATANAIVSIWMGLNPRFAVTWDESGKRPVAVNPEAIAHSVWRYRAMNGGAPTPGPTADAGGGRQGAADVLRHAERAGAAASTVLDGTGQPRPAFAPRTQADAAKESLKRAAQALSVESPSGRSLGFSRAGD